MLIALQVDAPRNGWEVLLDVKKTDTCRNEIWKSLNDIKRTDAPWNNIKKIDAPRSDIWESLNDIKRKDAPRNYVWESLNDIKKKDAPRNDIKKTTKKELEIATWPTPESLITSTEDEVLETANEELNVMKEDVDRAEDSIQERMKKLLDEFLINKNNLSPSEAQEIDVKIHDRLDDK